MNIPGTIYLIVIFVSLKAGQYLLLCVTTESNLVCHLLYLGSFANNTQSLLKMNGNDNYTNALIV